MRLLLSRIEPRDEQLEWVERATKRTVELTPGVLVSLCDGERLVESGDGRWLSIIGAGTDDDHCLSDDPEELARCSPVLNFDRHKREVMLVAHPLGRGTFFHTRQGGSLLVSTSLLDVAECCRPLRPNGRMVADYFVSLRNRGTDLTDTFVNGISQLPPGHEANWDGSDLVTKVRWTPLADSGNGMMHIREAAACVRTALDRVLARHVTEPTACLVSGGLDSSVVGGLATRLPGSRVSLVTYGKDLDSPRERHLRGALCRHLGATVEELRIDRPRFDLKALARANRGADSPSGGLFSGIFADLLGAARAAGFETVLTGEGGDEVFDPPPCLLADLMRAGHWGASLNALCFFASHHFDSSATQLLLGHGVLPLAATAGLRWRRPGAPPFLVSVLGAGFEEALRDARRRALDDTAQDLSDGWSLTTYYNYRQVLDLSVYEPNDLMAGDKAVRVVSPLASIEVFRAANALRLDEQAGAWLGFRSKRLLALAAADVLPYEVAHAPKTGIGNLLSRLVGRSASVRSADFDLSVLAGIGIDVAPRWLDPTEYPVQQSLIWALLLNLSTWFRELEDSIGERLRIPREGRAIGHL